MSQGRSRLLLAGSMRIGQPFVRKQAPWAWLTAAALLLLAFLRETQAEQFLHEFAGPVDGGGRISCVQYFVLRQEAQQCVQLTSSAPSIQGEVCSTVAGPLLAVYSPAADRNLFTARLVGPQVQMLPLTGCQVTDREEREEKARDCDDSDPEHESVVYGLMSGLIPGLYRLEVQWLYTGFSYGKDRLVINHDRLHPMNATVQIRDHDSDTSPQQSTKAARLGLPRHTPETCQYCPEQVASWPVCSTPYIEGTWLAKVDKSTLTVPNEHDRIHDPVVLRWQPYGCTFKPLADIDLEQCMERGDKHICFVGDSQTRHMFDGFVDALNNPGGLITVVGNKTDKTVHEHERCSYTSIQFGDKGLETDLDHCTHVIFNVGQWPLSHKPASRWSAAHFVRVLRRMAADINRYRAKHPDTRFYWASINSHGLGHMHTNCSSPALDYRTMPFTELFNAVATMTMQMHGIPTINTGFLSAHLYDLSYDGAHYHWAGSVGHYITEYVANVLCVQDA